MQENNLRLSPKIDKRVNEMENEFLDHIDRYKMFETDTSVDLEAPITRKGFAIKSKEIVKDYKMVQNDEEEKVEREDRFAHLNDANNDWINSMKRKSSYDQKSLYQPLKIKPAKRKK